MPLILYVWWGKHRMETHNTAMIVASDVHEARAMWEGDPSIVRGEPDHVYALSPELYARKQQWEFGPLVRHEEPVFKLPAAVPEGL